MALIKHLPPESAFKKAFADYDWPLLEQLVTGMWNETKAMRGDLYALIAKETWSYKPILPPSAERQQAEKRAKARSAHDDTMAQLRGGN